MMLTWRGSTLSSTPLRRLASAGWAPGCRAEPIAVCAQRYGYAPWRFRWRGDLYRVCRVELVRDEGGRAPRRCFEVLCADGCRYRLVQDLRAGTWHLEQ
jgi:hypothetical protein